MKDYLLLIRGGDARMETMNDAQTAEHMKLWSNYMGGLAQAGHLAGGMPLAMGGKLLTKDGATDVSVESAQGEVIGGYLLLKANDYNQAVELSKGCPVFDLNGNIEIREAMQMEM